MTKIVYTHQKSKLSKKARAAQQALRQEQRAIKRELKNLQNEVHRPLESRPWIRSVSARSDSSSVSNHLGWAPLRQPPVYTGDKMIGIGQMHKSNAVPIFKQEEAEEIARMRR